MEARNSCACNMPPVVKNIPNEIIKVPFNETFPYFLPEATDPEGDIIVITFR
jgi:hypothetical protein